MSNETKFTVQVQFEARWRLNAEVELTEAEYWQWCRRIDDNPRGFERERMAEDLMAACGADYRDGDCDDLEVEDFICTALEQKAKAT